MEAMTMAAMAQPAVLDVAPPDMSNQQGGIGGKRKLPGSTGQTGRTWSARESCLPDYPGEYPEYPGVAQSIRVNIQRVRELTMKKS